MTTLPDDYPDYLKHSDADTPVSTWEQATLSTDAPNHEMIRHLARIVANTESEMEARDVWNSWRPDDRRSVALIVDKIYSQGWLDAVGPIHNIWPGAFNCYPRESAGGSFADVLDAMSSDDGLFIECTIRNGLFAFLNAYNHRDWKQGWMEIGVANAALHIGLKDDGLVEIHLEVFNPLFIKGAPRRDVIRIPLVGAFNHKQFMLHRRWEQTDFAGQSRTSANFYHLMRQNMPLSF
ncbi:MAG: hypothetical protein ACJ74G_02970 [Blastocatellia bacterium]